MKGHASVGTGYLVRQVRGTCRKSGSRGELEEMIPVARQMLMFLSSPETPEVYENAPRKKGNHASVRGTRPRW